MRRRVRARQPARGRLLAWVFIGYLAVVAFGVFGPAPGDQIEQAGDGGPADDPTLSSIEGMTREKVSVTVDPIKVVQARGLVGSATLSHVIDVALDRLIVTER